MQFIWIGIGGFLGANARYLVSIWAAGRWGTAFPYGTTLVNILGSFIIALFLTLSLEKFAISPEWRWLFAVGFLGSFTTFSTFSYETMGLVAQSRWTAAGLNLIGEVLLGLVAVALGIVLARVIIQTTGG